MDSFGKSPNHSLPLIKDTLISSNIVSNKNAGTVRRSIPEQKDTVTITPKEVNNILETIKASNITDINSIKNVVTLKDSTNFEINRLSDAQTTQIVSAVKSNVAEHIAELIYSTKNNETILEITAKEKAIIDTVLLKLKQSQITNINQAIDFVKSHSSEHPTLFSKISGQLVNIVHDNEHLNKIKQDSFMHSKAIQIDTGNFSNPFKSDIISRNHQPKTPEEAKEFLNQVLSSKTNMINNGINPTAVDNMSNLILANYLKTNNLNAFTEEAAKGSLKQIVTEDQMLLHQNILHRNVSYLNDIAAKVASQKAKTIITCRLIGEIGGSVSAALGMASIAGASPIIGLMGAFVLTIVSSVLGFIIGKAIGEEVGKIITKTNLNLTTSDNFDNSEFKVNKITYNKQEASNEDDEDYDDNDDDDDEDEEANEVSSTSVYSSNDLDSRVSDALKSRIMYMKK